MRRESRVDGFTTGFASLLPVLFLMLSLPTASESQELEVFTNLGLYGGEIEDIAIDPTDPDKMFAASYLGDGLFMSLDGGESWEAVRAKGEVPGEDEFRNHKVFAIEIAPSDPQIIWVAHNDWVEKSVDGGVTWTHIRNSTMQRDCTNCGGEGDDFRFCQSIAIDPDDAQTVYVGTSGPGETYSSGAVYKTADGGQSWKKLDNIIDFDGMPASSFDYTVIRLAIHADDPDVIWAITNSFAEDGVFWGSLYHTNDGGETWNLKASVDAPWYDLAIKPDEPNVILTALLFGVLGWVFDSSLEANLEYYFVPPEIDWILGNNVRALAFDPLDPDIVYAAWAQSRVSRSTDGGQTFGETYEIGRQFLSLAVHPTDGNTVFGGDALLGVYRSENGGEAWTPVNDGINAVIVYDVKLDPSDSTHILAGTISGVYERKGSGLWSRLLENYTRSLTFRPNNSQIFYAGMQGFLAKTEDGGINWTFSEMIGPFGADSVNDIAIDPENTDTIFVSSGDLYKSTDGGETFVEVLAGVNQSFEKYPFNAIAIDPSNSSRIFAGGGSFFAPRVLGDLWESTDGGDTWNRTSLTNVIVNALLIDPEDPSIMYAGTGYSGGTEVPVYKSTDGGATWAASFDGIPVEGSSWNAVTDLAFHSKYSNVIYASTQRRGVFISPNRGETWLNLGTPAYDVFAIAAGSLFGATQGGLLQLTGTGCVFGNITDSLSQSSIDNATVFTDTGVQSISVHGEYMMIAPAGIFDLTSTADGYANMTIEDVNVYGGDVAQADFSMQSGVPDPGIGSGGNVDRTSGGNKYCFIATAAYGTPLAKQVEVLRKFRDKFLLPTVVGRKLVDCYYRVGRPVATYMDSHPWLKRPVSAALYPAVGIAWLMDASSGFVAVFLGIGILVGLMWACRRTASRKGP